MSLAYIAGGVNDGSVATPHRSAPHPLDSSTHTSHGGTLLGICTGDDEEVVLSDSLPVGFTSEAHSMRNLSMNSHCCTRVSVQTGSQTEVKEGHVGREGSRGRRVA